MVITVFKTKFEKQSPRVIYYRSYKHFDDSQFKSDLLRFSHLCTTYEKFENIFLNILEIHAPLKQKTLRANEVPYMSRKLRKAIMKRSQLESKYYKSKTLIDHLNYKKQKTMLVDSTKVKGQGFSKILI